MNWQISKIILILMLVSYSVDVMSLTKSDLMTLKSSQTAEKDDVYLSVGDRAPFSGYLITEQHFRYYDSMTEGRYYLKEELEKAPPVEETSSGYGYVGAFLAGLVISAFALSATKH